MRIGPLLAHLGELELQLAAEFRAAGDRHRDEADVFHQCRTFAIAAEKRARTLEPEAARYGGTAEWRRAISSYEAELLPELRTLALWAQETAITWVMAGQAAKAARDEQLLTLATQCVAEVEMQQKWFLTRIKSSAPQALVVA